VRWNRLRSPLRWAVALSIPALLLAVAWRRADPRAAASLLAGVGPWLPVALLPYAAVIAFDTLGWRLLTPARAGRGVGFRDLYAARLAGEAVAQTVPWAGLAGETASAWLLGRSTGAPVPRSLGGLVVRRLLMASGHGIVLAASALAALAEPSLPWPLAATIAATALLLLLVAVGGSKLVLRGAPFGRLQGALDRRPWPDLGRWPRRRGLRLSDADRETARLLAGSWSTRTAAGGLFVLVFVAEAAETWLLLRLLGAPVTPAQALVVEPVVSLVRAVAVFAPAGLGVQDLGYLSLLQLLGIPNAAAFGAAFVLLKRLKELLWTSAGWSLLLASEARPREAHGPEEVGLEPRKEKDSLHLRVPEPDHADAPDRARALGA
jgi:uncharacterized membrane protein YbhN (UPF0104 family)